MNLHSMATNQNWVHLNKRHKSPIEMIAPLQMFVGSCNQNSLVMDWRTAPLQGRQERDGGKSPAYRGCVQQCH